MRDTRVEGMQQTPRLQFRATGSNFDPITLVGNTKPLLDILEPLQRREIATMQQETVTGSPPYILCVDVDCSGAAAGLFLCRAPEEMHGHNVFHKLTQCN